MTKNRFIVLLQCVAVIALITVGAMAQGKVTSPKEQLGFNLGDDYQLANYTQLVDYWKKLDLQSERMTVQEIGKTAEGRPMFMAIVTSPENHKKLARLKAISSRLAKAEGLTEEQARALAHEGKAVVWIDGGLHATEVLGAQQLMEIVYQMVSMNDPETTRLLNDVVMLFTCVNPDGMELVANWYMRGQDQTKRTTAGLPRLYQKYVGHDNNRDFYMSNQPETEAINRVFYLEWFPQIVYNHHQTGPAGTVLFAPPFRDPFNYFCDPLVPIGIDLVGAAMHSRFLAEGKPGATMRSGSSYSTWWNGGLRTTVYFHNMIGLLTESIGNPTPITIPFVPANQLPRGDLPFPIAPQTWHFRQSIDYSVTANRAVLDVASKHREDFLYNIYRMGRNSIEKGSRDNWTIHPKRIAAVEAALGRSGTQPGGDEPPAGDRPGGGGGFGGRGGGAPARLYEEILHNAAERDPRGFILPSDQPDFLTATKFVNTLIKCGVTVHRATASFQVAGKSYPAGSYIVKSAQPFRAHVLDMFEPQDHPNDIPYPGGPPRPPYDSAGWTLAFQMGIKFDRILDGFDGPFEKIKGLAKAPSGKIAEASTVTGYFLSHEINDAFVAVNRLHAANEDVYWLSKPAVANGKTYPAGTMYLPAKSSTLPILRKLASDVGLIFEATTSKPSVDAMRIRKMRIGLWDRYGGSMPSGWVRWLFEKYEFPFQVVFPPTLDAGDLASKFEVLIFVDGGIPGGVGGGRGGRGGGGGGGFGGDPEARDIPAEYRDRLGSVTVAKTVPQLKKFLEDGGTILTIGSSTGLAYHIGLPVANHLAEKGPSGADRPLPREKYYVPGSVLQAHVDTSNPIAWGITDLVDMFFDNSPVFDLQPDANQRGVRRVAWLESPTILRSGWAWGEKYLDKGFVVLDATVGKGKLYMFGPEITFRAQPHGTFKFLFNGIYLGHAESAPLP